MKKGFLKRISVFLTMVVACLFMSINTAQALDRQKDDSDLTQINIYQFTLTRDNMTVLSQGAGVKRIEIPASDTGNLPSTAFVVQPTKDGSNQQYAQPLSLSSLMLALLTASLLTFMSPLTRWTLPLRMPTQITTIQIRLMLHF
ncbi:MAG: hypothetical protein HXK23_03305 [Lancefieldella parvula]|uniref:Sgo0707 N-terminal domain-containing protein n=1 Tax=Lancefieldella parvula TaxID=1382 RepID=A0A930W4S8_9ACTN|nr:hypothetical protein [Lancefieldella parvula]